MKKLIGCFQILTLILSMTEVSGQTPFGTQRLKKSDLFIDVAPVSNVAWAEYLAFLKKEYGENSAVCAAALPDSLSAGSYYVYWQQHKCPVLAKTPVVGISMEQAEAYAQWRTIAANIALELRGKKYRVEYMLPTETVLQQFYACQKRKIFKSSETKQELTSNRTITCWTADGTLYFESYTKPDTLTVFRCMARLVK